MPYIFCVTGHTGAGKDTICSKLLRKWRDCYGTTVTGNLIPTIQVTDRPRRESDTDDTGMNYINKEMFSTLIEYGILIEKREYETKDGIQRYGTTKPVGKNHRIMVASLLQMKLMKLTFDADKESDWKIIPIIVTADDIVRLHRTVDRATASSAIEICHRFIRDIEIDYPDAELDRFPEQCKFYNNSDGVSDQDIIETVQRMCDWTLCNISEGLTYSDIWKDIDITTHNGQSLII